MRKREKRYTFKASPKLSLDLRGPGKGVDTWKRETYLRVHFLPLWLEIKDCGLQVRWAESSMACRSSSSPNQFKMAGFWDKVNQNSFGILHAFPTQSRQSQTQHYYLCVCEKQMLLTVNSLNSPRPSPKPLLSQLLWWPPPTPIPFLSLICRTYLCVKLFRKKHLTSKAHFTSSVFFKKILKHHLFFLH